MGSFKNKEVLKEVLHEEEIWCREISKENQGKLSDKYNTDREAFLNELKVKYGVLKKTNEI